MRTLRVFGHHVHPSCLLLGVVEGAVVAFVIAAAIDVSGMSTLIPVLIASLVLLAMGSVGLFQAGLREAKAGILMRIVVSFAAAGVLTMLTFHWLPAGPDPMLALIALGGALVATVAIHAVFLTMADQGGFSHRVLVLGTGRPAEALVRMRRRADRRTFELVGFRPVEGERSVVGEMVLVRSDDTLPVVTRALGVDEVVVALEERRGRLAVEELKECRLNGVHVTDSQSFYERETGKVRLETLRPGWLAFSEGWGGGMFRTAAKRIVDVVAAVALLAVVWPVMVIAAAAVAVESGWPVFYLQTRVGRDGKPFRLIKFRSMRQDAEPDGKPVWAARDDPRVTRVGAVMRMSRIDELPQLFNVLKGEMSFVGPRPERPEFVAELEASIPFYSDRHRVKPGVTGWAQLCYPYGSSAADAVEKLQYDLYYLKNRSLFLDLVIIAGTVEVVLFGKGAR